jgi:hypothetical protein
MQVAANLAARIAGQVVKGYITQTGKRVAGYTRSSRPSGKIGVMGLLKTGATAFAKDVAANMANPATRGRAVGEFTRLGATVATGGGAAPVGNALQLASLAAQNPAAAKRFAAMLKSANPQQLTPDQVMAMMQASGFK